MLGKNAGGLYWLARYLERTENISRLVDTGFRIALTHSNYGEEGEWSSILATAGAHYNYDQLHDETNAELVIQYLLQDKRNPSSVVSALEAARNNAKMVRTALTREVWEAVNETWMTLTTILAKPIRYKELPEVLAAIRQHNALVRGTISGTMMRSDVYNFLRIGTFIERSDSTARILDVKYYVLLPSVSLVGSSIDNIQWENILRSVSAHRSFRKLYGDEVTARAMTEFLILDRRMPRSLAYCFSQLVENLEQLQRLYQSSSPSYDLAKQYSTQFFENNVERIFDSGLHEYLVGFLKAKRAIGVQIEQEFRFSE